ncbi:MAG: Asp-tRNA(Asn)/Glu-tRNA(Gln) amidotransferase subunit GatC [Deltaproteobacteria bacterium]|nr:Asp-tRNA(Asn)/Glu-tRNA(Gln) amidotransferase subunit GatC [Deltaproteobacteria bacterium]
MSLSPEQVRKVAALARLALTEEELATFTGQLGSLLDYFRELDELEVSGVQPTSHVVPLLCPEREDAVRESLARSAVMGQAPQGADEYFLVPKVLD